MSRPAWSVWWPTAAGWSVAVAAASALALFAVSSFPPSAAAASSVLASLPAVSQNAILEDAYVGTATAPLGPFVSLGLRVTAKKDDLATDRLADGFRAIAGNSHAVVACGMRAHRPVCLVRGPGGAWQENTPANLAQAQSAFIERLSWRMVADAAYVYLFDGSITRFSSETWRWHDGTSWQGPPGGGSSLAVGASAEGIVVCDKSSDQKAVWRLSQRTKAGWRTWPGSSSAIRARPVLCGVQERYLYALATSQADRFPPRSEDDVWRPRPS